jgi:two-component system NarL family sensor kinase
MLFGNNIGRNLFVLIFLLVAFGCNAPKGNIQCPTASIDQFKNLSTAATAQDVKHVIHFYDTLPEDCHNAVAFQLTNDLFDVLYVHQKYDTIIIPFFNKLSEEKNISIQYRSRALLKTATYYLYALEDVDRAVPYLDRVTALLPQLNDSTKKGYYAVKAQLCLKQSNLKEATTYYLKNIEYCERLKDSAALAAAESNFSTVYSRMGDYEKAVNMKKKTVAYFLGKKDYNSLIFGYIGVGTEYGLLRNYDSATRYYLLGIDLIENKGVYNPNMAFTLYSNLAGIEMGQSYYDKARYYYSKAKDQLKLLNNPQNEKFYIMSSAPAFANSNRSVEPEINQIKSFIPGYLKEGDYNGASNAYYALYHVYYILNKKDIALKNFVAYDSLKSMIADDENKKYVAEMETKYETQKKQLKIEVQQKEIKKERALNGLLAVVLLAVILLIALFITRLKLMRNKREAKLQQQFTKKLLENTEEERIRIARDLHDGVSQELMILKNQMQPDEAKHKETIDSIINEIRSISRDLHPVMLEKIGLKASVEHICEQLMENNYIFISSEINYDKSLNKAGELQMFRMIQEALNNIIKYAKAEAAKVTISETERSVAAEIIDNGKGFDVEEALRSKSSFGLMNLKERSKAMNGKTVITSSKAGTIIKIEIPKSDV